MNIIAVESNADNLAALKEFARGADPQHETKIEFFELAFDEAIPKIVSIKGTVLFNLTR